MIFNERLNFNKILEGALINSRHQKKHVLVEFGGDWCNWSRRMNKVLKSPPFFSFINERFIFIRCPVNIYGECHYPEDKVLPVFNSVPYFILINENGDLIGSHDTSGFCFLWFYKKKVIFDFLESWSKL